MHILVAAILAASVLTAGESVAAPVLSPGKPAGVKHAIIMSERKEVYLLIGVVAVSTGAAIALLQPKGSSASTSTSP